MFDQLKVVTVYNDERRFEIEVNDFCSKHSFKIISCEVTVVANVNIVYTAFLGKLR